MEGLRPTRDDVELPEELQARVLEHLPPNDRALSGRFVSKRASRHLSQHCTARLSLPLPRHAVVRDLPMLLQPALKQLSFKEKLGLPSVAASSGSEANMELAWALLRPCLFPELLSAPGEPSFYREHAGKIDAGAAAVRSGGADLLSWVLQHHCRMTRMQPWRPWRNAATFLGCGRHGRSSGETQLSQGTGTRSSPQRPAGRRLPRSPSCRGCSTGQAGRRRSRRRCWCRRLRVQPRQAASLCSSGSSGRV